MSHSVLLRTSLAALPRITRLSIERSFVATIKEIGLNASHDPLDAADRTCLLENKTKVGAFHSGGVEFPQQSRRCRSLPLFHVVLRRAYIEALHVERSAVRRLKIVLERIITLIH